MSYLVHGNELCPTTGRKHWQCYAELRKRVTLRKLKQLFHGDHHFERRNGTPDQAASYCKEDGDWKEFGKIKVVEQGKRNDLESLGQRVIAGESVRSIAESAPAKFIQYGRGLVQLEQLVAKKRQRPWRNVSVTIIWGTTRVGKTRGFYAAHGYENTYSFQYSKNNDWWDGYQGEKHVLFDEFSSQVSLSNMLKYCDGHPMRLEVKNGHTYADWDSVTIISNDNPQSFYSGQLVSKDKRDAFAARVTQVVEMRPQCTTYKWSFAFSDVVSFVTGDAQLN